MILKPSETIYAVPGTLIPYQVYKFSAGESDPIQIPNSQYQWTSSNISVASVVSGNASCRRVGVTTIVAQVENITENNAKADIHVVLPEFLNMKISHFGTKNYLSNWSLIKDSKYTIVMEAFESENHLIYSLENFKFEIEIDSNFIIIPSEKSATTFEFHIIPKTTGHTFIRGKLVSIYNPHTREFTYYSITKPEEVVINHPIVVVPRDQVAIPYCLGCHSRVTLSATGGSGDYVWSSLDQSLASINSRGVLTGYNLGSTSVTAYDSKDPSNYDSIRALLERPTSIQFVQSKREIEIGKSTDLSVLIYYGNKQLYNDCSICEFNWEVEDPTILQIETIFVKGVCATRKLIALREGFTKVYARLDTLVAETTIVTYLEMSVSPPSIILALGSSTMITITGGPDPWIDFPEQFVPTIKSPNPSTILVQQVNARNFKITCLKHVDQIITVSVGNTPTDTNPDPVTTSFDISYVCKIPSSIFIYSPVEHELPRFCGDEFWSLPTEDKITPTISSIKYSTQPNRDILIKVLLLDENGNRFTDFSSLNANWFSSKAPIASFKSQTCKKDCLLRTNNYGQSDISITFDSFDKAVVSPLKLIGMEEARSKLNLRRDMQISVLQTVQVSPQYITLYAHPENRLEIKGSHGSEIYRFQINDTKLVTVESQTQNSLLIAPRSVGYVKITANDQCLIDSLPSESIIHLSEIEAVEVIAQDSLQLYSTTELTVILYDKNHEPFTDDQYQYVTLEYKTDTPIQLTPIPGSPSKYHVKGVSVGLSTITFSYSQQFSGKYKIIVSSPKTIYVYEPFSVYPEVLEIVAPAYYQLQLRGGPPTGMFVSFKIDDGSIATVDELGIVHAKKEGKSSITATAVSSNSKDIIIGSQVIPVIVKSLSGILLFSQTTKLTVGDEISVYVTGQNGESPFSYGTRHFQWESSNTDVASVLPRYELANVTIDQEAMFSARVVARSPGRSRITVNTNLNERGGQKTLTSSVQFFVFDHLKFLGPSPLIIQTEATYQIETSLDSFENLKYSVLGDQKICTVTQTGRIFAKGYTGICPVLIESAESGQSLIIVAEIKQIHMLELLLVDSPSRPATYSIFVGSSIEFLAVFRDDLGRQFAEVNNGIKLRHSINIQDAISVQTSSNHSIIIQAFSPCNAVLKVFVQGTEIHDYVRLLVGNSILPVSPNVHTGGSIIFKTTYKSHNTTWSTSNSKVIEVSNEGKGTARTPGTAIVDNIGAISSSTLVNVVQIDTIRANLSSLSHLSNFGNRVYYVPVEFSGSGVVLNSTNNDLIDHKIRYECSATPKDFITAVREVDQSGNQYCKLTTHKVDSKGVSPSSVQLTISASDAGKTYSVSHTENILFCPEFTIPIKSLNLYPGKYSSTITVNHGHCDVSYHFNPKYLSVIKTTSTADTSRYEITVKDSSHSFSEDVIFTSTQTNQKV